MDEKEAEEWELVQEEFILVEPRPPRFQSALSERQSEILNQLYKDRTPSLVESDDNQLCVVIGGRQIPLDRETGPFDLLRPKLNIFKQL